MGESSDAASPDRSSAGDSARLDRGGDAGACGGANWMCTMPRSVLQRCTLSGGTRGLPDNGSGWLCQRSGKTGAKVWTCFGPRRVNSGGWSCARFGTWAAKPLYRCVRPESSCDMPTKPGGWVCVKGSAFGGTMCEWSIGKGCLPGTRRWCDDATYDGYGVATCKQDGTWPTRTVNGKQVSDCQVMSDGRRPQTVCACYHFWFTSSCCEREDCLIPKGSNGHICPVSAWTLCSHCNPLSKTPCAEPGAICVTTNSH